MKKAIFIVLFLGFATSAVKAQVNATNSTGVEPMYAYKGGLNEAINIYNGNLSLTIPLLAFKGRAGQDLSLSVSYDSRQLRFYVDEMGEHAVWNYDGWTMGRWTASFFPSVREWSELHPTDGRWRFHAEFTLEDGARHHVQTDWCGCQFFKGTGWSTNSTDMSYDFDARMLRMKNGVWYDFNYVRKGDANGNYLTFETGGGRPNRVIDNLGRSVNFLYDNASYPTLPKARIKTLVISIMALSTSPLVLMKNKSYALRDGHKSRRERQDQSGETQELC